ncbi:MAG: radical SAM protein [Desulfobacteraceae bacterium]|nr:radical SAM protein [Desulfobacteraceae bacterium]
MKYYNIKTLYLELTYRCNQKCFHCYEDASIKNTHKEMSTSQIIKVIKGFKNQGGKYLIITGGEPLIRKDCFEILNYINDSGIKFSFASNSLAMNGKRLKQISGYKYLKQYFTSLLGSNEEEHQNIAGKNSYRKVFDAIDYLDNIGIETYIQVCVAKGKFDIIGKIINEFKGYNNCILKFTPIAGLGIKKENFENRKLIVGKDEFKLFHEIIKINEENNIVKIDSSNICSKGEIIDEIENNLKNDLYSLQYGCVCIRPDGDMSFSFNLKDPYVFGKAYDSLKIPVDTELLNYINMLKKVDQKILEEINQEYIEYDSVFDDLISAIK